MSQIERTKHDIYQLVSYSAGLKDCTKGRVVLVIGGRKGIGKVTTPYLASLETAYGI